VEWHEHGPRLRVLDRRIHECHTGLVLVLFAGARLVAGIGIPAEMLAATALLGAWMVIKDWRDIVPAQRDTATWSVAIHRRRPLLREVRRGAWVPACLAWLAATVGIVNIASALTPDLPGRAAILREAGIGHLAGPAHALALPVGVGLVILSVHLGRRRRRAWALSLILLGVLGALDLVKGLDVEEALGAWALAGLLAWARGAFHVRCVSQTLRSAGARVALIGSAAYLVALVAVVAAHESIRPDLTATHALREAFGLLAMTGGPGSISGAGWLGPSVGLLGAAALVSSAAVAFRPGVPPAVRDPDARSRARRLVERYGRDTLSFFKLREDVSQLFSPDRRAFLAYRVDAGVLVVSGDPVGPAESLPDLVRELLSLAEKHGLRVCVLGAGRSLLGLYRAAGLRALYLGDEAIVDTRSFSLEGRPIRKVRQSVTRLTREGYSVEILDAGLLDSATLTELEGLSARWRKGAPERGFSMAMDRVSGADQAGSMVVIARDGAGRAGGFLHLVPCFGRSAMSLSMMRRNPETPNGLTEFLVAETIGLLRARGIDELSLNFAVFGRLLRTPAGPLERHLAHLIGLASRHFQIESLYRFNAKFFPHWEPRYLLHEGVRGLPRTAFAALRAEGQIPTLFTPGRQR
jgi:lysyl-tRNA synthetase class 2